MVHRIKIDVKTAYVEAQSQPEANRYVFAYTITIVNRGTEPAQLLRRHWVIRDANDHVQEVHGDGVVGEQPNLDPGGSFQYTSGAVLETPVGTMRGHYEMVGPDGQSFLAEIPQFTLSVPRVLH